MVLLLVVCQNNFHPDIQLQHSQGHSVHFNTWIVVLLPQLQHHQAHTLDLSCFASQLQSSRLLFEHCKAIEKPVSVHNSKLFIQLLHSLPYSLQIGERRQRQDVIAQQAGCDSILKLLCLETPEPLEGPEACGRGSPSSATAAPYSDQGLFMKWPCISANSSTDNLVLPPSNCIDCWFSLVRPAVTLPWYHMPSFSWTSPFFSASAMAAVLPWKICHNMTE